MKHRQVTATEFKAKCLALLDEVNQQGGTVTITMRGKPVATLQPLKKGARKSSMGCLAGKIEIAGDIVNFNTADMWEAFTNPELIMHPERRGKQTEKRPGKQSQKQRKAS